MRVALTGLSGRRHPKNLPMRSRLAAISLRHKQPKTRPRDGTEKPVRSVMYTLSRPLVQKVGPVNRNLHEPMRKEALVGWPARCENATSSELELQAQAFSALFPLLW